MPYMTYFWILEALKDGSWLFYRPFILHLTPAPTLYNQEGT